MKIWYVTSECAPFSKSGGLADVAYSLPPVLKAAGNDVEIVTPLYRCVWDHFGGGLTFRGTYPVTLKDQVINAQIYQGDRDGVTVCEFMAFSSLLCGLFIMKENRFR